MKRHRKSAVLALALVGAVAAAVVAATARAGGNGDLKYVADPPTIQGPAISTLSGTHVSGFGSDCAALFRKPPPLVCYDPTQIRDAYDVPDTLTGSGQTIVIVDAYGDPTIEQDLAAFDANFGLAAPPSFTVYRSSNTQNAGPHDAAGWAVETALDVEWAHAIAPGAAIVLAEAPNFFGNAINSTEAKIVPRYPGSILSQSFGTNENAISGKGNNIQVKQADENYQQFARLGITVIASTGDLGATTGSSSNTPSYPASDPWVTAVGGTQGIRYPFGLCIGVSVTSDTCRYGGEEVWNEPDVPAATGGAPSQLFGSPSYQAGLTTYATRTTPDVSYNAAINGGVLVVQDSRYFLVGGTSAGSPQWAGIFALANEARAGEEQGPIGFANPMIYSIYHSSRYATDFHDITAGDNTLAGAPVPGFSAGSGYDLATGIGTPDVANLIDDLK
jgi:subtilase family serine protease